MQIDGVSPQGPGVHPLGKTHPKDQKAAAADQPVTEQESNVQQTTEDSDSDGVLRLLQEGHFKGVSDIRLRINFYNELAAIEAQQLQAVADEQIDGILQTVGSIVGILVDDSVPEPQSSPELLPPPPLPQKAPSPVPILAPTPTSDDGGINFIQAIAVKITTATIETAPPPPPPPNPAQLQEDFTETVNQLKDDFLAAEAPSTDALLEGIQSAFDQLVESLELALAQPDGGNEQAPNIELAVGLGGEIEQPDEPETVPQTEPIIEDLKAAFNDAMNQLIDAFGEVKVLTPTSEPNGNGGAYQKFLNIYNEMREGT